jgi:hypothetical protein
VHDGNVVDEHALILRSYWRGKMPLIVHSLRYSRPILRNLTVLILSGTAYVNVWYIAVLVNSSYYIIIIIIIIIILGS